MSNLLAAAGDLPGAGQISVGQPTGAAEGIGSLIANGITAVIILAALLTFAYLVYGGIEWLTSGGDKEKYESARNRITAAVIGLAIVIAAYAVMQLIAYFFAFDISNLQIPGLGISSVIEQ